MDEKSDHDLLICLDVKLKSLITNFENHLTHHFKYSFYAFTVAIGLIVTLIVMMLKS